MVKTLPWPQGSPSQSGGEEMNKVEKGQDHKGSLRKESGPGEDFLEVGASEQSLEGWVSLWPVQMRRRAFKAKGPTEAKEGSG